MQMRTFARAASIVALVSLGSACQRAQDSTPSGKPTPAPAQEPTEGHKDSAACASNARKANLSFALKDMNGRETRLEAYKGKVVLIDFWATWCGPCKMEVPAFVELYDSYRPRGFEIVGLLTQDDVANVPSFAREFKINYPILDANGRDDIDDAYGPLYGLPTSFLISRDGRVCRTHVGYSSKEEFAREIEALLAL